MKGRIEDLSTFLKAQLEGDECGVKGCSRGNAELVVLQPLDPIDHRSTPVNLCPKHTVWAQERNEFAEEMHDELREARKEIGKEHSDRIAELATPQDGELREDILVGEIDKLPESVAELHEGEDIEIREVGEDA